MISSHDALFIQGFISEGKEIKKNHLYHVLSGKRTASNLFQAKENGLFPLFGWRENIKKSEIDFIFSFWIKNGQVSLNDDERYIIRTKKDVFFEDDQKDIMYPFHIQMGRFGNAVNLFWNRIQLITQVLSHQTYKSRKYIPIVKERDIQLWVKDWLREQKKIERLPQVLGQEVLCLFEKLLPEEAFLLSRSMSGFQQTGSTARQRASFFNINQREATDLPFIGALHSFYRICLSSPKQTHLFRLAQEADADTYFGVTKSTSITYSYLKNDKSPSQISQIRKLKEGTIWEHLIEWALVHPEESMTSFIPEEIYKDTKKILQSEPNYPYSSLKNKYPDLLFSWFRLIQMERNQLDE